MAAAPVLAAAGTPCSADVLHVAVESSGSCVQGYCYVSVQHLEGVQQKQARASAPAVLTLEEHVHGHLDRAGEAA